MQPEYWLERWAENAIGFHQPDINSHLQAFWHELGLAPGSRVLVPLCGKSLDMLWLLSQGHEVLGVELSPTAVAAFFEENDLRPTVRQVGAFQHWQAGELSILCGDFFQLTPDELRGVSAVYDRASLVALPPAMRRRYADHLAATIAPGVPILLVTVDYPQDERDGPPFSVSEDEVRALYAPHYRVDCLHRYDIKAGNPRYQALSRCEEKVYRLSPRQ